MLGWLFGRQKKMKARRVPELLRPFIPLADKWGSVRCESDVYDLAEQAEKDPEALSQLEALASCWTQEHMEVLGDWLDRKPVTKCYESDKFNWLFAVLDVLGISVCQIPSDPITALMRDLEKPGSGSRAMGRMWAARKLPDRGDEAKRAVPLLKKALTDRSARVQIWVHAALALIEGDTDSHKDAIVRIARERGKQEEGWVQMEADEALQYLARTPYERDVQALTSAAIIGDLVNTQRLVGRVDVNARNKDGGVALMYAVNSCKTAVVQLLLEHGADPNTRGKDGKSFLHDAAWQRKSPPIIELLVEYGADVNARDSEGQTPLDVAKFHNRTENIELLRRLGAAD